MEDGGGGGERENEGRGLSDRIEKVGASKFSNLVQVLNLMYMVLS